MSPMISSEKVLCIRKLSSSKYAYKFSKISHFCMKARFLSLATITVNCLPWNDRLTVFIFEKSNALLQITIACLEAIEMMVHGGKKYLVQLKQFHKYFTSNHPSYISIELLFSRSVMSNSLWTYALQHSRLPCSSPSPRVCSDSCPLSRWCQYIAELLMSTFYFVQKKKKHLKNQYLVKWRSFTGHY